MATSRCTVCGLLHCLHKQGKKKSVSEFGSYYDASPGWDDFCKKESAILKAMGSGFTYASASGRLPPKLSVEEVLKTLNDSLTSHGWGVDISPAIDADDRRGFIITILEPKNVERDKT